MDTVVFRGSDVAASNVCDALGRFSVSTAALAIGIVRYRLFDIKLVLRSGLVYGTLTTPSSSVDPG